MRNPPNPHPSLHPNRRERRHGRHRMEEPPRTMLAGRRVAVGVAAFAVASVGLSAVSAGASNAPRAAAVPGIDLSHTNTLSSTADELDAATGGSLDLPTLVAVLRAGAILGNSSAPGVVPDLSAALPNPVPGFSAGLLNPGSTAPGSTPQGQDSATATATDIPARVLLAYRAAAARAALENPSCGIRWEFLAAFGRMETNHGRFGGSSVAENGVTTPPIYGAPLNGSRPGVIGTVTTAAGAPDRAAGPMQFISSTWAAWGRGGDVQNIDDATNGAARYLCAGGRDLTTAAGRNAAALSYNHADWYAADIEALFLDYVSGRHGASYPAQPPVDAPVAPTGDLFGTPADGPAPAPTATATAPAPSTGNPAPSAPAPSSATSAPTNTSPAPTSATPAPTGNPAPSAPAPTDTTRAPTTTTAPAPAPTSATPAPTPSGNPTSTTPAPRTTPRPTPTSATPAPTDATRAPATTTAPAPSTGNPTPAPTSATPAPTGNPTPAGTPTSTAPATPTLTVGPTPAKAPGSSPQATPDLLPVLPVPLAPGVLPLGGR
jgi:hypothetical protein